MSILDPESLMLQTDWEPLTEWMKRRAEEKGLKGVAIYGHVEEVALDYVIDQMVMDCAIELGMAAGRSFSHVGVSDESGEHNVEDESAEREAEADLRDERRRAENVSLRKGSSEKD